MSGCYAAINYIMNYLNTIDSDVVSKRDMYRFLSHVKPEKLS
jgi:hypothetical protein